MKSEVAYCRTYWLQCSHFNGAGTYRIFQDALEQAGLNDYESAYKNMRRVLSDCHGHNFKIVVRAFGFYGENGILVDDLQLEQLIRQWDNNNLSVLEEFGGGKGDRRVTTELMAETLANKCADNFKMIEFSVDVYETDQIFATATRISV